MIRRLFFLLIVFAGLPTTHCQVGIGIQPFFRSASGPVDMTYGAAICIDHKMDNLFFHSAFSMTVPRIFPGTATISAFDSSTVPFQVYVPLEQKVTDYILHLGGGVAINPNNKTSHFMATFGFRGIFRTIRMNYLEDFDETIYNKARADQDPYLPAALNIGLNLGIGYWYQHGQFAVFPNISGGFGTGDKRDKHPWNNFPAYIEFGCRVLVLTKN